MLVVRLLGSQSAVDAATGTIATRSARTLALIGLLVARAGVPQDRAAIAGAFWPESGDPQALTNLRRELHQLRRLLGPSDDSLEITSTQICWHEKHLHEIDLAIFLREDRRAQAETDPAAIVEHGTSAIEAYAGPLLPALDEPWLDDLREEIRGRCRALCDRVSRAAGDGGRVDIVVSALRKLISIDRYDERAHRMLMRAYAAQGDRARAIGTYHRLATTLESELGVAPDRRTTAVLAELRGPADGPVSPRPTQARGDPVLVARQAEMNTLITAWRRAAGGAPGVLVVRGGAGVGKSRLVGELVTRVRREGGAAAVSRCFDTRGRLSLAPVADWLREPVLMRARERLAPLWRAQAALLVPEDGSSAQVEPAGPRDVWQRHRFFEGLARALLAGSGPLLLVLDNVQWSDPDTLSFVRFLLNVAPRAPLLVVATTRPNLTGTTTDADRWLGLLRDDRLLVEMPLNPLDVAETTALAAVLTGQPRQAVAAELVYAATSGFPLYVVEAARSSLDLTRASSGGGVGWMGILRRRVQEASPAAREVAGLAAAVGRDFEVPLLVEASDLAAESVVTAVDELWGRRLIREVDGRYDFAHDLLRQAAYETVTPARRWLLHRRLAQALELLRSGRTDAVAAQIAQQYRSAGNPERAMRYYRRAAQVAAGMYAHEEALALLDEAHELLTAMPPGRDRDGDELSLLEESIPPINARYGYSAPRLRTACERAVELGDRLGHRSRMVTAMVGLWASRFVEGRITESHEVGRRAVALVEPGDERFGQAHFSLAGSALHLGRIDAALDHFAIGYQAMGDESLSVGTRARVHTAAWWAHAVWFAGDPRRAASLAARATAEARVTGHRYSIVVALAYEAITRQLLGERDACAAAADEACELCTRHQFSYYGEWGRILRGWASGGAGGAQLIDQGLDALRVQGALARRSYWLGLRGAITPDADRAGRIFAEALADAEEHAERLWVPVLNRLRVDA